MEQYKRIMPQILSKEIEIFIFSQSKYFSMLGLFVLFLSRESSICLSIFQLIYYLFIVLCNDKNFVLKITSNLDGRKIIYLTSYKRSKSLKENWFMF